MGFIITVFDFMEASKVAEVENPCVQPQGWGHEHSEWKLQGATLNQYKEEFTQSHPKSFILSKAGAKC